jgi:hypothetical protein
MVLLDNYYNYINRMVYTSITGGYDAPRDDVKVFTEYDRFKEERLNAKIYKCLPHLFMPKEKWWVWIDGNLKLKVGEEKLIEMAGNSDVAVFENPYRDTVGEELEEVKRLKLDKPERLKIENPNAKLPACFLIIRRNTPEVRIRNEAWWAKICAGSVRDQLTFSDCYEAKFLPKVEPFDNPYFTRHGHLSPRQLDS